MGNHSSSVSRCGTYIGIFGIIEMNLQTVAQNLRATIAGKEELLTNLKGRRIPPEVTIHFLEVNIAELKRILQDVEQCEPSLPGESNNYEKWDGDE